MPYEIKAVAEFSELQQWLIDNVGSIKTTTPYWCCYGKGWEMMPHGRDSSASIFDPPKQFIIRVWDKELAFITKLRWE